MTENQPVDPWRTPEPSAGAGWGPPQATPYGAPAGEPPPYGAVPYGLPSYGPPRHVGPVYPLPHEQGGTNGFAVASVILGLLWVFWIGSILAVVFGVIGLRQIGSRGGEGRGLAITGIVAGSLGLALLLLLLVVAPLTGGSSEGAVVDAIILG